jgi:3-deoxy-D-manno-octulosonic-acid transferase
MLYALCSFAYVGGGFGRGLHNILEPAAHARPILFGPQYQSFPEAIELIREGGAFSIRNATELLEVMEKLKSGRDDQAGNKAGQYIRSHQGATEKITSYLLDSIPFGNEL